MVHQSAYMLTILHLTLQLFRNYSNKSSLIENIEFTDKKSDILPPLLNTFAYALAFRLVKGYPG